MGSILLPIPTEGTLLDPRERKLAVQARSKRRHTNQKNIATARIGYGRPTCRHRWFMKRRMSCRSKPLFLGSRVVWGDQGECRISTLYNGGFGNVLLRARLTLNPARTERNMLSRTLRLQPFPLGKGSIEIAIELGRAFLATPPDCRNDRIFQRFRLPSIALGCKGSACDNPVLNRLLKAAQREHAPYRPYGPRPSPRQGTAATAKERRPGLYAIRRRHGSPSRTRRTGAREPG